MTTSLKGLPASFAIPPASAKSRTVEGRPTAGGKFLGALFHLFPVQFDLQCSSKGMPNEKSCSLLARDLSRLDLRDSDICQASREPRSTRCPEA